MNFRQYTHDYEKPYRLGTKCTLNHEKPFRSGKQLTLNREKPFRSVTKHTLDYAQPIRSGKKESHTKTCREYWSMILERIPNGKRQVKQLA
jgi:hypothetical protein